MSGAGRWPRYLDQIVDVYDPEAGLRLPETIAWAVSLELCPPRHDPDEPGAGWLALLAALLRDPAASRLRTLLLVDWSEHAIDGCDIPFEDGDPAPLLRRHGGRLRALERLHVGELAGDRAGAPRGFCQGVAPALAKIPTLRRLELRGERGWELVPRAGHPGLEELVIHVGEADDDPIEALCEGSFPALTSLDLWLGGDLGEALGDHDLAAALAGPGLPALTRCTLRGALPAALVDSLAAAPELGPRLGTLTITDAPAVDDDALAPLLDAPWLARLALLDLRGSGATAALAGEFAARGVPLRIDAVTDG